MGVNRECLSDWLTMINAAKLSELSNEQTKEKTRFWNILRHVDYEHLCEVDSCRITFGFAFLHLVLDF